MSRIVVLGDLNLDVHAKQPGILPPGAEARSPIWARPGGSAGTFARLAAEQGAQVTFIGCVGDDLVGDLLIQSLERSGVQTAVARSTLPSGIILAYQEDQERSMICSRGANDGIGEAAVAPELFDEADHLHISGYAILSPNQRAAARRAIEVAQSRNLAISLDPPPANLIDSFGVDRFRNAIEGVSWLLPNRTEGETLTGRREPAEIVDALAETYAAGALTMGSEGSLAWRGEARDLQAPSEVLNADPTGAGDAFAAAFVVALLDGEALSAANAKGCASAREHLSAALP